MASSRRKDPPVLAIVVPCYNEEEVLPETIRRLTALLTDLSARQVIATESRFWFVDDGSRDGTWPMVQLESQRSGSVCCGLKLSRNAGHQVALLAGLLNASGDVPISVDADLQDEFNVIPTMFELNAAGSDIEFAVRSQRHLDTWLKRVTAEGYYRLLGRMKVDVVFNHADYRLMSRRTVVALRTYGESNLFLRGLIPLLGFPTSHVEYVRQERFAGESKYPLSKMLAQGWQGITSFSAVPSA